MDVCSFKSLTRLNRAPEFTCYNIASLKIVVSWLTARCRVFPTGHLALYVALFGHSFVRLKSIDDIRKFMNNYERRNK